jgi:polyprenyl-phospho-N-acetylgalactosaminyl synthase
MKTFIVIAAYNEEKKLGHVLKDLKKTYRNIVVVDDGSKDKTFDVAEKEKVTVLRHVINRGQGAALKTGIDFAISQKAEIIVTFDADGQFLVGEIPKVLEPIERKEVDVTLGSRFIGRTINMPFLKKMVLKLGVLVVYVLYGIKVTDSQCGFRAMSRKAAEKIRITSSGMEHAGEIFWEIVRNDLRYKEVPVTVIYDEYSLRKGQPWTRSIKLGIKMVLRRFFI